ncbi:unnamed protein product [Musa textilis]
MFSVELCAGFQSNPKLSHFKAVKMIFRYLKGTPNIGLWYLKSKNFELIIYADANFARCGIDIKGTYEICQLLGRTLVSWPSKKQNSVALFIAEVEYIAVGACCAQVIWMKNTLENYVIHLKDIYVKCDNTSVICLIKNPIQHSRTKHIVIRHHFIRDYINNHDICLEFINIKYQLADYFYKTFK